MIRKALLAVCLLAAPLSLSGCGFTPVYAQKGLGATLAGIEVNTTDSRTGYFVRQNLVASFDTASSATKPYRLDVKLVESRYDVGIGANDTAIRSEISNMVTYELVDVQTRAVLTKGNFVDTTTYDATSKSPYGSVISQKDGQQRAATSISDRLRSDITLYFHGQTTALAK
ncbi:hypothetical protein [Asticcacaulis sp. YBE204]|uniref:hypothetical protein n=1 Tax=Asticcacaulis sp. YBE204 TaxID=1282363 RepID=UPI0003C3D188|nr:hypothetical protein [Asticcacaulis sp. YBE204]ESQ80899.1 hypothetical protein AEYBE204_00840 [Asticcacaulis sp. YBE204]